MPSRMRRATIPRPMASPISAVAATWLWTATHLGDLPGFPASGRRLTMSGATVYGFDAEDRLTGHWQVTDRLGIVRQLQAGPQAGA